MNKLLLYLLLVPAIIFSFSGQYKCITHATEDEIEEELVDVETEDNAVVGDDVETDDDDSEITKVSANADTYLLFTKPLYNPGSQFEIAAGYPVEFLVGFMNKGEEDFVIDSVEASFRYPMDFTYYIQNFSAIPYDREVKSSHEATVSYSFLPSDSFAGRPFGLNIALNYHDSNGGQFTEAVFNETVQIIELDEGLDGETFFLYVFLAAIVVLLLVLGQQYLVGSVGKRKRSQAPKKQIETGTSNNSNNVDYDWLPEETLRALQNSPKKKLSPRTSPKSKQQSPRQRKTKRTHGSDD